MKTQQLPMPAGNNTLPPLAEFSLYETLYYNSYVNYQGRTITYKLVAPVTKRIS